MNGPWVGLFQQAADPASGLYTQYDRTDPAGATTMFLQQLVRRVPGYDTDPRQNWELGEVVQESHVGQNVAKWQDMGKALAAVLYSGTPPPQVNTTCSTDTTGAPTEFDPGNIISDAVFYNDSAFPDVAAVQAALDRIGATCTAPTCLRLDTYTPGDLPPGLVQGLGRPTGPAVLREHPVPPRQVLRHQPAGRDRDRAEGIPGPHPGQPAGRAHRVRLPGHRPRRISELRRRISRVSGPRPSACSRPSPGCTSTRPECNYPEGKTSNILWNVAETGCGSAPVTGPEPRHRDPVHLHPVPAQRRQPGRLPR